MCVIFFTSFGVCCAICGTGLTFSTESKDYTVTNQDVFLSPGGVVARSKAINYLVAATVERHDRNSGRRPVESGLFSFISQATSGI